MISIQQRRYPLDIQFECGAAAVTLCATPSPYASGPESWSKALQQLGCPATARHPADWPNRKRGQGQLSMDPDALEFYCAMGAAKAGQ